MFHFSQKNMCTIITHEWNVIASKTHLDGTTHGHTIICRQLFADHVVGSRPMKRKTENTLNDISYFLVFLLITCFLQNALILLKQLRLEIRRVKKGLNVKLTL